jgi:hypothetical protein
MFSFSEVKNVEAEKRVEVNNNGQGFFAANWPTKAPMKAREPRHCFPLRSVGGVWN